MTRWHTWFYQASHKKFGYIREWAITHPTQPAQVPLYKRDTEMPSWQK